MTRRQEGRRHQAHDSGGSTFLMVILALVISLVLSRVGQSQEQADAPALQEKISHLHWTFCRRDWHWLWLRNRCVVVYPVQ